MWVQPLYYSDQQQLIGNMQAYSSNTGAIIFGLDRKFKNGAVLGFGGSYFNVTQKYCNFPDMHIDLQNFIGFIYGSFDVKDIMQIDWLASAGVNYYTENYILNNIANASASYIGQQYLGRVGFSKTYQKNSVQFIPQFNANVLTLHQNGYTENASGIPRTANTSSVFTLGGGFKMISVYTRGNINTIPEIRAFIYYDLIAADVNAITAMIIGGPALRTSTTPGRSAGQFGGGVTFVVNKNFDCKFNYDLFLKNVYFNNVLSLKVIYYLR